MIILRTLGISVILMQAIALTGSGMVSMPDNQTPANLENFDDLFVGNPIDIERRLKELLPEAVKLKDHSIYLQIMSQIALAQAMQKKFHEATVTLDAAEALLKPSDFLAHSRILLERGRVLMQQGDMEAPRPFFLQSYELAKAHHLDFHTANAAHMIAMIATAPEEKIKWNLIAIELAEHSNIPRAQMWLGALYNNLGQAYIEAKEYTKAQDALQNALKIREQEGYAPNIRVAKWAVARTLRFQQRYQEALDILLPLQKQYEDMVASQSLDFPEEMLPNIRGLVYEELAEVYAALASTYARMAYNDLSHDEWFRKEQQRLERMKQLSK